MQAYLKARGFSTTIVDNNPLHGNPRDDFTDPAFFNALLHRVQDGEFFAIFAGVAPSWVITPLTASCSGSGVHRSHEGGAMRSRRAMGMCLSVGPVCRTHAAEV